MDVGIWQYTHYTFNVKTAGDTKTGALKKRSPWGLRYIAYNGKQSKSWLQSITD